MLFKTKLHQKNLNSGDTYLIIRHLRVRKNYLCIQKLFYIVKCDVFTLRLKICIFIRFMFLYITYPKVISKNGYKIIILKHV